MSSIVERAQAQRLAAREDLRRRFPHLVSAPASAPIDRSAIVLGRDEAGAPLFLPLRPRLEHMHAIGTTGGGKSTLLTHCVRQDIIDGSGVLFVDPHGDHRASPYRSLLAWLDETGLTKQR